MSPIAKIPGSLDLEARGLDLDQFIVLELQSPVATGPSFMVNPKNGSSASQAISKIEPSLLLTTALASWPSVPFERSHLSEHEIDFPLAHQRHHLVDAVGGGAEFAAPVQKSEMEAIGARLSVQSSAESPPPAISKRLPRNCSIWRTA